MTRKPVWGLAGLCCLGLALSGCKGDGCGCGVADSHNNIVPVAKHQGAAGNQGGSAYTQDWNGRRRSVADQSGMRTTGTAGRRGHPYGFDPSSREVPAPSRGMTADNGLAPHVPVKPIRQTGTEFGGDTFRPAARQPETTRPIGAVPVGGMEPLPTTVDNGARDITPVVPPKAEDLTAPGPGKGVPTAIPFGEELPKTVPLSADPLPLPKPVTPPLNSTSSKPITGGPELRPMPEMPPPPPPLPQGTTGNVGGADTIEVAPPPPPAVETGIAPPPPALEPPGSPVPPPPGGE